MQILQQLLEIKLKDMRAAQKQKEREEREKHNSQHAASQATHAEIESAIANSSQKIDTFGEAIEAAPPAIKALLDDMLRQKMFSTSDKLAGWKQAANKYLELLHPEPSRNNDEAEAEMKLMQRLMLTARWLKHVNRAD